MHHRELKLVLVPFLHVFLVQQRACLPLPAPTAFVGAGQFRI